MHGQSVRKGGDKSQSIALLLHGFGVWGAVFASNVKAQGKVFHTAALFVVLLVSKFLFLCQAVRKKLALSIVTMFEAGADPVSSVCQQNSVSTVQ